MKILYQLQMSSDKDLIVSLRTDGPWYLYSLRSENHYEVELSSDKFSISFQNIYRLKMSSDKDLISVFLTDSDAPFVLIFLS